MKHEMNNKPRYYYTESNNGNKYLLHDTYNQYIVAEFFIEDDVKRICDLMNKNCENSK